MICVYALRFEDGSIYVGMSKDLSRREKEHLRRQSPSMRKFPGEFEVIYQKPFPTYMEARSHEKYLKSGNGRKMLQAIPSTRT